MNERKFPSLIEQGKNLAQSIKNVASDVIEGKEVFVPEDIKKKRIRICKRCDYFYESLINFKDDRCTACGCFIEPKMSFASSECPKNKWKKYENK